MKILHVISSVFANGGGTSEVVPRLCQALKEAGEDVTLAAHKSLRVSDNTLAAVHAGVRYEGESIRDWFLPRSIGYSSQFRRLLPRLVSNADIVHIHGLWQLAGWMAAKEAIRQHKPYVMMPHGFLEPERLKLSPLKKKIMGALFDNSILRRANGLVATSESEAEGIRKYGLTNPIHIMPIGLDIEKYELSKCAGKTLLYFSRITPVKGLDMLAEVWGKIDRKGWRLLIVGPDDRGYTAEMKTLFAARCPADSYEFRPPVFGADKYKLLSSVDAFVLPTRSENWSIAVAEAMTAGLPIVCTKGAPWRCIREVGAGAWVDISIEGIAQGLLEVINVSDDLRIAMGRRGRAWVEDNLQWTKISRKMIEFYNRNILLSANVEYGSSKWRR